MAGPAGGKRRRLLKPLVAGDVFEMCAGEHGFGYGQVIQPGTSFYASILKGVHDRQKSLHSLSPERILLLARTTDGCLARGEWRVVGNLPLPSEIPYPKSKVHQEGKLYVADFEGRFLRVASEADADLYDYSLSVTSPLLQAAWLAHSGLEEARYANPRLTLEYVRSRSR